jgi:IS30 family transposase
MKKSIRWIGRKLKRDHTVINREIKSHSGEYLPYTAKVAQEIYERKITEANKTKIEKNPKLKNFVISKIKNDWSPEEVAGVLESDPPDNLNGLTLCHETIYNYIYNYAERHEKLYSHLRYKRKTRQPHYQRKKRSDPVKNKVSIEERPEEINERKEYGHWETDLMMVGKRAICVSVERKSLFCRLKPLNGKKAEENERAIWKIIEEVPEHFVKTITRDNGMENALHEKTKNDFNVQSYFCHPYASWEKGTVENLNGLLRQYFPKKDKGIVLTAKNVSAAESKLNNRPRKKNNYLTPNQIYEKIGQVVQ